MAVELTFLGFPHTDHYRNSHCAVVKGGVVAVPEEVAAQMLRDFPKAFQKKAAKKAAKAKS